MNQSNSYRFLNALTHCWAVNEYIGLFAGATATMLYPTFALTGSALTLSVIE